MNYKFLARALFHRTKHLKYFSSDDMRQHKLDEKLDGNPQGRLGAFFRWLKAEQLIEELGEIHTQQKQGHGRRIRAWTWTQKAWRLLHD